jgi:hypothetical protein
LKEAEIELALKISEDAEKMTEKKVLIMKLSREWNNVKYCNEIRMFSDESYFDSFGFMNFEEGVKGLTLFRGFGLPAIISEEGDNQNWVMKF